MQPRKHPKMYKKFVAMSAMGTTFAFPFGACDLSEITTTTTTTLDASEIVIYLVRSAIITPIDTFITNGVQQFFDQFEDDD